MGEAVTRAQKPMFPWRKAGISFDHFFVPLAQAVHNLAIPGRVRPGPGFKFGQKAAFHPGRAANRR